MRSNGDLYEWKEFTKTACCTIFYFEFWMFSVQTFEMISFFETIKFMTVFKNRSSCYRLAKSMRIPKNSHLHIRFLESKELPTIPNSKLW